MDYFEETIPDGDGVCSDKACPCSPSTVIRRGDGHLYIEQTIVDWRRQYPRLEDARRAMGEEAKRQLWQKCATLLPAGIAGIATTVRTGPIFVCERGARLRNLDLKVAAADAKLWWKTGQVPLRATPTNEEQSSANSTSRLLGREISPQEDMGIQSLLEVQVARALARPELRESETMRGILTGLLEGRYAEFTKAAVTAGVDESLGEKTHVCCRGSFSNLYLAVSTVPSSCPSGIRAFFPGGYVAFVTEILNASEYPRGSVSLAHWTYGSDGDCDCAHLTLFPARNLVRRGQGLSPVVAGELCTEQELAELGLT